MNRPWGIDIASVDGNAPITDSGYEALWDTGCRFIWLRASFCDYDVHHRAWVCLPDTTLQREWERIPSKFRRGAYVFFVPQATQTAAEQIAIAGHVVRAAGGLDPGRDFAPCGDVEYPHGVLGAVPGAASRADARHRLGSWLVDAFAAMRAERWSDDGAKAPSPYAYMSQRVYSQDDDDCLNNPSLPELYDLGLWLARYWYQTRQPAVIPPPDGAPPVPAPWHDEWLAWQDQGDALGVPGMTSTADIDVLRVAAPGDRGGHVARWQRQLKMAEGTPGVMDDATVEAVRAFQADRALTVDGIVGAATAAALSWLPATPAVPLK